MNEMFSVDRLYQTVSARGNVCVGLDTALSYVPFCEQHRPEAEALLRYNEALVDATFDVCACYKIQIAYYEALGRAGLDSYARTLSYIRKQGGFVIADIKRGDIADTASYYAKGHFSGDFEADMVTLNPYMGMDSLEPWLIEAHKKKKGAFVLLRTSNKGFMDFEGQKTARGGFVYDLVGEKLLELAERCQTDSGYGIFGAVVGAEVKNDQEIEEARTLRSRYKKLFFLVPGYGAQGGGASEAALLLTAQKNGGVVNASRSILKAWQHAEHSEVTLEDAAHYAREAVITMRNAIRGA
jgi:orotidine-5'-phosphate decarboxylase